MALALTTSGVGGKPDIALGEVNQDFAKRAATATNDKPQHTTVNNQQKGPGQPTTSHNTQQSTTNKRDLDSQR
jgi:hypothetical protein